MILIVDNYDSFTFNLVHQFKDYEIIVLRNDDPTLFETAQKADGIVLSPGPGRPEEAGDMLRLIETFKETKPFLGICLGHQAIAQVYGADTIIANTIMHGKQSNLTYRNEGILSQFEDDLTVMRYHSLMIDKEQLSSEMNVLAEYENCPMIIEHQTLPIIGIQFHPESLGTPKGQAFIDAFIDIVKTTEDKEVSK